MGVSLVRSLQPPDILWIQWRLYNFIANTRTWVLFLPPSDAYVRRFLYLLYTLIKLYYTKFWAIKPHLSPQIEFFSSGGHESRSLFVVQQQPFKRKFFLWLLETNHISKINNWKAKRNLYSLSSLQLGNK